MIDFTRREALRKLYQVVLASGASQFLSFDELEAAVVRGEGLTKPNLVWLHGTSCSGCSTAFLDVEEVTVLDIVTKFANIHFHPDLSLATGEQVVEILEKTAASKEPYIFVLEGGIPAGMPHACMMADRPMTDWVHLLGKHATACVAAGTCSSHGGIPMMAGTLTGSMTMQGFLESRKVETPVVNLPNCPMRPEHIIYTLLHFAKLGKLPELDGSGRPLKFFKHSVHERCIYYSDFQEKRFARKIGEDGCLFKLGCQGPVTKNDCLITGHNGNTNTCIRAGHPCVGCAGEHFPRQIMFHSYQDQRSIAGGKA